MEFDCDKCGCCCRILDSLHSHLKESYTGKDLDIDIIKDMDGGNGVCKHLGKDNLCTIYSSRPDICNTKVLYDRLKKYTDISEDEYYSNIKITCKMLRS